MVVPDSEFVTFELTNGIKLPWLRYFGWLVTVPVLLMFLVSLTVHGYAKKMAKVRYDKESKQQKTPVGVHTSSQCKAGACCQ